MLIEVFFWGEMMYLIFHCILAVCFSILVNNTLTNSFNSSCGLKQKDSLSPLLFVIVMEALGKMIYVVGSDLFIIIFKSRFYMEPRIVGGINISHLLFADDTLIYCAVDPDHLCHLRCLFLCFETISDLKINLANLEMVHICNVDNVEGLARILGCMVSSLPVKYLSLPLGAYFSAKFI